MKRKVILLIIVSACIMVACNTGDQKTTKEFNKKEQQHEVDNSKGNLISFLTEKIQERDAFKDTLKRKKQELSKLKSEGKDTKAKEAELKDLKESLAQIDRIFEDKMSDLKLEKKISSKEKTKYIEVIINKYVSDNKNDSTIKSKENELNEYKKEVTKLKKELNEIKKEIYLTVSSVSASAKKKMLGDYLVDINIKCKLNSNPKVDYGNKTIYLRLCDQLGRVIETDDSTEFNFIDNEDSQKNAAKIATNIGSVNLEKKGSQKNILSTCQTDIDYNGQSTFLNFNPIHPKSKKSFRSGIYEVVFFLDKRIIGSQTIKL